MTTTHSSTATTRVDILRSPLGSEGAVDEYPLHAFPSSSSSGSPLANAGVLWVIYCVCFLISAWILSHASSTATAGVGGVGGGSAWQPLVPATKSQMRARDYPTHERPQFKPRPDPVQAAIQAAEAAKVAAAAASEAAASASEAARVLAKVKMDDGQEITLVEPNFKPSPAGNGKACPICYYPAVYGKPLPWNYFGERFVFFGLGGQFNNQRGAFMIGLWFARLLNRTIVLPTAEQTHLSESFDMWALSHYHPVVASEQLPQGWLDQWGGQNAQQADAWEWVDIWYLTHADYEADPEQDKWLHSNVMPFVGQPYRARFLLDEYGPDSPKWNAKLFYTNSYWGYTRTTFAGFPIHLIESMTHWQMQVCHFTPPMFELANRIISVLPERYLSIHWRMGDYEGSAARQPWMLTAEKVIRYFVDQCGVKKEDKWHVYIASDTPHHNRIQEFERRAKSELDMTIHRWEDYQEEFFTPFQYFPHYSKRITRDSSFVGQVEIIILAKGKHYIGTGASTFSDHVYLMMPEFDNRREAIRAQIDYDLLTGLTSSAYRDEERPGNFKPATKESKHSREVEKRILAQLPPKD